MPNPNIQQIPLDRLDDPLAGAGRPPPDPDSIRPLADSIAALGLLQPPGVRPTHDGRFDIVFGRRRIAAAQLLGWTHVPCLVAPDPDADLLGAAVAENLERQDLSPLDEARLLAHASASGLGTDEIAARIHRSRRWVEDRILLLHLPDPLKDALQRRQISLAVAQALSTVAPPATQTWLLHAAIHDGCTAAVARQWASMYSRLPDLPDHPDPDPTGETRSTPARTAESISPTTVTRTCAFCRHLLPLSDLALLPVCSPCLDALQHRLAALDPNHTHP